MALKAKLTKGLEEVNELFVLINTYLYLHL